MSTDIYLDRVLPSRKCPICGKTVIVRYNYAYRINTKWYCSYTCYRKAGGDDGKFTTHYARRRKKNM